jgi:hypothetical protein
MAGATFLLLYRRMLHPGICCGIGMTLNTYLAFRRAQEIIRPRCGLMRGVTFEAVTRTGIGMMGTALIQIDMTFETQVTLFTLQECCAITGVGNVTSRAVPLHYRGMPHNTFCPILHFGVAAQTQALLGCLKRERSALMTGGALALGYRCMYRGAPQRRFAPPVGVVTFGAAGGGNTCVRRTHGCGGMTAGTHGALFLMQEFGRRAAVGRMAGSTPLRYGWMGLWACILILGARMALKTQLLRCYRVKTFVLPSVGLMTRLAVSLRYGFMNILGELRSAEPLMAGIAHLRH